ncbi:MAG TPA: hypothetical protein VNT30_22380, partial [Stellaceae bacterium]|nr:hypothetical protein [Stellaceae bacterium]
MAKRHEKIDLPVSAIRRHLEPGADRVGILGLGLGRGKEHHDHGLSLPIELATGDAQIFHYRSWCQCLSLQILLDVSADLTTKIQLSRDRRSSAGGRSETQARGDQFSHGHGDRGRLMHFKAWRFHGKRHHVPRQ